MRECCLQVEMETAWKTKFLQEKHDFLEQVQCSDAQKHRKNVSDISPSKNRKDEDTRIGNFL